jgi:4-carboxymuconolactone decarboxylase
MSFRLQYAKDDGATEKELIEAITHLAFYAGWPPKGMSAMAVAEQASGRDQPDHPGAPTGGV